MPASRFCNPYPWGRKQSLFCTIRDGGITFIESMNRFRRFFYGCLLLAPTALAYGQPSYPHTLLWRISGKGMQKPSYLYGTMHLSDKRLFRFDDSVYRAIEKTDGLAIEVNPDEMGAY